MTELPRISRRSAVVAMAAAGVAAACRGRTVERDAEELVDEVAQRYVRCTLELAQHQPSLVETWLGPDSWRPGPRRPVADIRADIDDARATFVNLARKNEPTIRHVYLRQQLDALVVAARRLAGESMSLSMEARASLGNDVGDFVDHLELHNTNAPYRETTEAARATLEQRLPGRGPVHERYAAFRHQHALSSQRIMPALRASVERCRGRVRQHIALPETEGVRLDASTGLGVEARATYQGELRTHVAVDTSGSLDLARLLWLAAHETYPGHHLQHVLADRELGTSKGWHERLLIPAFGRHLLCSEGAAEAGAALLFHDERFESACRELASAIGTPAVGIADLVAVHRAVAELDVLVVAIARAYLDGEIGRDAAVEQLATRALVTDARQLLPAVERQRARILVYPAGRRIVAAFIRGAPAAERWSRLASVATTLTLS